MRASLDTTPNFKPGDPPPSGYIAWMGWAEAQHKAGFRQAQCGRCGLWKFPQELSGKILKSELRTARGKKVLIKEPVCKECQITQSATQEQKGTH